jgi:hypothetical protein
MGMPQPLHERDAYSLALFHLFSKDWQEALQQSYKLKPPAIGDMTSGIPKYTIYMSNIHYIYQIIYAGYSKAGKQQARPEYIKAGL